MQSARAFFYYIYVMKMYKRIFLIVSLLYTSSFFSQTSPVTNAKIKTVFIFNFTRYFEWKDIDKKTEFTIGLVGANDALIEELNKLAAIKKINDLPIKIVTFKSVSQVFYTELLYVDIEKFPDYHLNKKDKNTLVITENNRDLNNAMIAFFIDVNNKQKFAVNEVNIKRAELIMKSELNNLAYHKITGSNTKLDEEKAKEWK